MLHEFSNTTPLPAKFMQTKAFSVYLFERKRKAKVTYANRKGKYMKQKGVTLPKFNLFNAEAYNQRQKRIKWKNFISGSKNATLPILAASILLKKFNSKIYL